MGIVIVDDQQLAQLESARPERQAGLTERHPYRPPKGSLEARQQRDELWQLIIGAVLLVGFLVFLWFAGAEARDGRPGQHWVCTESAEVLIDKFNGTETECVNGYWAPD